ncbi:MAG: peptide deformylase [Bulleidia sp.]
MIRNIVRDPILLSKKAEPAQRSDIPVGKDLLETCIAYQPNCLGMAANMIGVNRNIIVAFTGTSTEVMFNPQIVSKKGKPCQTSEACLSLICAHPAVRYPIITVEYRDLFWRKQKKTLKGVAAQVVQHEVDHTNGIVI